MGQCVRTKTLLAVVRVVTVVARSLEGRVNAFFTLRLA
jgi:hypothetical protein